MYAHDVDEPAKRERALALLGDATDRLVLSTQVLIESFHVLTRRLSPPRSLDEAREAVESLAQLTVVPADASLVRAAVGLSIERQVSIWDAMIVRAAQVGGCEKLLTEDLQDGAAFGTVRVENPFREL